jgi:hypothetical protein
MWAGLAAAAVGLSVIAAFANRGVAPVTTPTPGPAATLSPARTETTPRVDPAAPAPAPVPAPTPARAINVQIRTEPPNAEISLDDGPSLPNPYSLSAAPSAQLHRVHAKLTGYASSEQDVAFDQDREIVIMLRPTATGGRRGAPARPAPVAAAAPQPAPANVDTVVPASNHRPNKKIPRTLDQDNPFGEGQ